MIRQKQRDTGRNKQIRTEMNKKLTEIQKKDHKYTETDKKKEQKQTKTDRNKQKQT